MKVVLEDDLFLVKKELLGVKDSLESFYFENYVVGDDPLIIRVGKSLFLVNQAIALL